MTTQRRFKELSGTVRKDHAVHNENVPEFEMMKELPEPPAHLGADGVLMWNRLGSTLVKSQALQVVDLYAFEQLCYSWEQFRKKAKIGMEVTASENNSLQALFAAFGLNAQARRRIASGEAPKKNKFANNGKPSSPKRRTT